MSSTRPLLEAFHGLHVKCRNAIYARSEVQAARFPVPDNLVPWSTEFKGYNPVEFTHKSILGASFADPQFSDENFKPSWNCVDGKTDRCSHVGKYTIYEGRPLNPMGRTGLCGRGILGKWGPNHAADPIVTRWQRDANGKVCNNEVSGKPMLEFVSILRGDTGEWAIPGGMVDPGEHVSATLKREFGEEALNSMILDDQRKQQIKHNIDLLFKHEIQVYSGYVDDPRNTDNAWMETVAVNVHDSEGEAVGAMDLQAGDDAVGVKWTSMHSQLQLYASHSHFIRAVAIHHKAHWQ